MTATSPLVKWLGLLVAFLVSGLGFILGFAQGLPALEVFFYTAATFAFIAWVWRYYTMGPQAGPQAPESGAARRGDAGFLKIIGPASGAAGGGENGQDAPSPRAELRAFVGKNRNLLISGALVIIAFLIASATITGFLTLINIISGLILLGLLIVAMTVSRFFAMNRSAFIGIMVLVGLFVVGSITVEGFFSAQNVKSMLLFASFLGLACIGQTFVVLLGGLDLSIPFVIGAANVGLLYVIGLGVPSWLAVIFILALGAIIGVINGILSFRLQGQALIVTLGTGFAVSGGTQILTSIGSSFAGNVFGAVPDWLKNLAAMSGKTLWLDVPPVIVIWIAASIVLIFGLKNTVYGRRLYAIGGNRTSARRLSISERRYWIGVYTVSGAMSAMTGALLLGWSGGGFIGVGQPYLFMSLAAVVVGGTSLLGGYGGYGFTVIGVLVLQVLTSFLVGIGLRFEWQQAIIGLLILPMVALYARSPHIRSQI